MNIDRTHIDTLLYSFLEGNTNEEEQKELLNWIKADKANEQYYIEQSRIYKNLQANNIQLNPQGALKNIKSNIKAQPTATNAATTISKTAFSIKSILISGVTAAAITVGSVVYFNSKSKSEIHTEPPVYKTKTYISQDSIKDIILEDSSRIYLNENSKLSITETDTSRNSVFSGNAIFEIMPDSVHPFIVVTPESKITSYGGSFEIETDSTLNTTSVTAIEGSTRITTLKTNEITTISEKQKVTQEHNNLGQTQELENLNEISWKTGVLEFSRTPLRIAIPEIEKFYNKKIIIENEAIYDCQLNAKLDRYAFDNVLEMFRIAFGITIEQDDATYYLSGQGCE